MGKNIVETSDLRIESMLQTALGESAGKFLQDTSVIELMLNDDGKLWVDRLGQGRSFTGVCISAADAERAIFIVASSIRAVCSKDNPILSAELPGTGSRFQGMLPPVVARPSFTIRKKALKIITLDEYVEAEALSKRHKTYLKKAIKEKKNIVIAGGTGSGKTTLANAVLREIALEDDRIIIIEDTKELQCEAKDSLSLRTKDGTASMTDLLKATMRLRPDRIIIGEVRGAEALVMLKAWNTGHPGGCTTVHADSARRALSRLEQLVYEAGVVSSKALIGEAVNVVLYIEKTKTGRVTKDAVWGLGLHIDLAAMEKLLFEEEFSQKGISIVFLRENMALQGLRDGQEEWIRGHRAQAVLNNALANVRKRINRQNQ